MVPYWQKTFGVDRGAIGQLMFYILTGTGSSMYLAGLLQKKIPYHLLIVTGNIVCSCAMLVSGFATSMSQIYIWGFLTGFFCGFVYIPVLTVAQTLYPEKKGTISGIANLTFGFSAALLSPIVNGLLFRTGAPVTTVLVGCVSLIISVIASYYIKAPDQDHDTVSSLNSDADQTLSLKQILSMKSFWFLWCVWALSGAGGISMVTLSSVIGEMKGFSVNKSVYILIGFNIMNGLGRMISGHLSDHFRCQTILSLIFLCAGTAYLMLPYSQGIVTISLLAACVGLAFGSLFTVSAPLVTECFGLTNFGTVFGLVFTAYGFFAGFLGPWLSGLLLDYSSGDLRIACLMLACFYAIASVLIRFVRHEQSYV